VPLLGSVAEVEEVHLCFLGLVAVVVEVAREEGVGQGVVEVGVAAFRRGWPGAPPKIVKSRGMTSLVRLLLESVAELKGAKKKAGVTRSLSELAG
jgi:hypothetical protein